MAILYQWQVSIDNGTTFTDIPNDTVSVSGTRTAQILFKNLTTQDHKKQFRVRITDTDSTIPPIVSRPAILFTAPTVNFDTPPANQVSNNQNASFSASASVDRGQIVSYQWQRKPASSNSFVNMSDVANSVAGSKSASLQLSNLSASLNNNDKYRLVVTAQCCGTGPLSFTSNEASLSVLNTAQSLYFSTQPQNTAITNNSVSFSFVCKLDNLLPTDPIPPASVLWQEIGTNGSVTDLSVIGTTTSSRSGNTITYTHNITIANTAIGKNYRAILSAGSGSIISQTTSVLQGVAPCTNCGGSGTGDPHYYFGIQDKSGKAGANGGFSAGFDDNKNDGNGARELLMLYIRDKNTNTEYLLTTKNTGAFGSKAPFSVGRTSASAYRNGELISGPVNDGKFDMMGVAAVAATSGRFAFTWSILDPSNIGKLNNLDIEMGGAWYWMLKSYLRFVKKDPQFMNLGWPYIGWIRADGIGIGLAPYGLKRENFEVNTNDTLGGDPKDISRLRTIINDRTVDDMKVNSNFWTELSDALRGGTSVSSIFFSTQPVDSISINGSVTFTAVVSDGSSLQWQISKDNGKTWTDIVGATQNNLIINVSRNDNGYLYRAVANNRALFSNIARLTVPRTIIISKEPTEQYSKNFNATFSVVASGVEPMVYQWEKSDDNGLNYNNVDRGVLPVLQITDIKDVDDGDLYRVNIQDGAGDSYTSGSVKLRLDPTVVFTQQPSDATADNDEKANFTVQASCDNGGIKYRWQMTEDDGKTFSNITSLDPNNATLALSGLKISDHSKKYRAQVITDIKSNIFYSSLGTLSVPGSITINSFPTNQLSVSGEATFTVNATSSQPPLTYKWQTSPPNTEPKIFTDIIGETGSVYVATGLTLEDDNRYYRVILEDQRGPVISPSFYVDTTPQITITQQPSGYIPTNYKLVLGTNATTTNGTIEYVWQRSTPNSNIFLPIDGQNSKLLEMDVVPADSGNQYRAKISVLGARDSYTNIVKIDVPPSITVSSKLSNTTKISFPNKTINLSIDAQSVMPPLTYQWQKSVPTKTSITYTYDKEDVFYDYTQLFLQMNGVDGSKTIVDSSKNVFVPKLYLNNAENSAANMALSTSIVRSGQSSLRIGERGAIRVTDPTGLMDFGNQDFTIECWCYPTGYSEMAIASRRLGDRHPAYASEGWALTMNKFKAKIDDTWNDSWIGDSLDNIPLNEWTHVALSRRNMTYRLFRNGNLIGFFTNKGVLDETSGSLNIGIAKADNHENQFNGYLDQFKITTGLARYVDSFNPEFNIDNTYDAYYNSTVFENIPGATGSLLALSDLGDINNHERYRVVLTDSVSSIILEE